MYPYKNLSSQPGRWARGVGLLLVLALLFSMLPIPASAAPLAKVSCKRTYEVKRGDTLTRIGNLFNYAPVQIVNVNGWNRPYTIYVGQRICIPTAVKSGLPKLEARFASAGAVYFTAGRSGSELLIYTYNYPKTNVLVKVYRASDPSRKLYNLGSINIAAKGNRKSIRFKLPTDLRSSSGLLVCLKDRTTSYLQCVVPRTGS